MRRFTTSFRRTSYSKTKEKGFSFSLWSHSQPVMIVLICYFMLYLLEHRTLGGWVRPSEKPKVLVCDLPHRLHASCTRSQEELGVAVAFGHGQVSKLLRTHLRVAGRTWEAGPRMSSPNSQCVLHCSISQVKKSLRQQMPIISLQAGAFLSVRSCASALVMCSWSCPAWWWYWRSQTHQMPTVSLSWHNAFLLEGSVSLHDLVFWNSQEYWTV